MFQEQLGSFLSLAEELELKGLNGSLEEAAPEYPKQAAAEYPKEYFLNQHQRGSDVDKKRSNKISFDKALMPIQPKELRTAIIDPDTVATVESMIEKRSNGFACIKCDYTSKHSGHMREHAEKHITGLEYPCDICNKVYRSSDSFRNHKTKGRCL